MNRYEIHAVLREQRDTIPSPSTIYRVLTRYGLNRRTPAMREEKRRIIKDKLGELGHVDLHQLPRDIFLAPPPATAYIVSLIDSCSRLAWAEVLTSKKALPVMFKTLKMINTLNVTYGLIFQEILSDNGSEFASRNQPHEHPFEAMLLELGIRHAEAEQAKGFAGKPLQFIKLLFSICCNHDRFVGRYFRSPVSGLKNSGLVQQLRISTLLRWKIKQRGTS